jgi:hypothetical protein
MKVKIKLLADLVTSDKRVPMVGKKVMARKVVKKSYRYFIKYKGKDIHVPSYLLEEI